MFLLALFEVRLKANKYYQLSLFSVILHLFFCFGFVLLTLLFEKLSHRLMPIPQIFAPRLLSKSSHLSDEVRI